MQCPNCGATILESDSHCKKCNHLLHNAETEAIKQKTTRSRLALLLLCWAIGWFNGGHLKYLGYDDKAASYAYCSSNIFKVVLCVFNPFFYVWFFTVHCVEIICIMFGKYKIDAHGNPVKWL